MDGQGYPEILLLRQDGPTSCFGIRLLVEYTDPSVTFAFDKPFDFIERYKLRSLISIVRRLFSEIASQAMARPHRMLRCVPMARM
jgi:hypothetical protein